VISTIDVPVPGSNITDIVGINDSRGVAGRYFDSAGNEHAFIGTLTPSAFWGVDSLEKATKPIGSSTLFDVVASQAGMRPAFWGRYLGDTGNLTLGEIIFLHARNCNILIIFRDTTTASVKTYLQGADQAKAAIRFARNLGVPGGVWIYADLEPGQAPTAEWFQGWFKTMQDPTISPYGGGVYGNTATGQDFNRPYCVAYNSFTSAQQAVAYVYANQPQRSCVNSAAAAPPFSNVMSPPCNPPTVIYQYSLNCLFNKTKVDLDVANAKGFASMWAPP